MLTTHTFPIERRYITIPNDHQSTAKLYDCPDSISGAEREIYVQGFELQCIPFMEKYIHNCSILYIYTYTITHTTHVKYPYMVLSHK